MKSWSASSPATRTRKSSSIGGAQKWPKILNLHGQRPGPGHLGAIAQIDAPLAPIQDLMFVFDDLVDLDDREMQLVLREVSGSASAWPCVAPTSRYATRSPGNMSQRAAEILLEDMEARGSVKLSDVVLRSAKFWPSSNEGLMKAPSASAAWRRRCCDPRQRRPLGAKPALDAIAEPSPLDALIIETITAEPPPPPLQLPTPEEIQAIREAARQEGFEQGRADGYACRANRRCAGSPRRSRASSTTSAARWQN